MEFGWTEQIPSAGSWAGPRQLWQLAEESPQFQLSHYYPGPQVELLGGKVGDIFTQLSIVSAIVEQFVYIGHTFLLDKGFCKYEKMKAKEEL